MAKKVLTYNLSEPLASAMTAKVEINTEEGNLTIDTLTGGEPLLASGTLEYLENQGLPIKAANTANGQASLSLKAKSSERPWFHFPWQTCNGATQWLIHLNPNVSSDISAHSGGGNVRLNLSEMATNCVSADTGGGNMELVLPDHVTGFNVTARTGAGNVTIAIGRGTTGSNSLNTSSGAGNVVVQVPHGIAARIQATSGMGKVMVDPQFGRIDKSTYQSPDFDEAGDKVEINAKSGAGNVVINVK